MSESPLGVGPVPALVMLVGEAWGEKEERAGGIPFVGISGEELNRYLSWIRISRDEVYVTNLVNERPPNNSDPTREMIAAHEPRLREELLMVRPAYVVTLGRFSTKWFLGEHATMEREWGIGHTVKLCGDHGSPFGGAHPCAFCHEDDADTWSVVVCAIHHPAYGLYSPDEQSTITRGFEHLREIMDGARPPHPLTDPFPVPLYIELTDAGCTGRELRDIVSAADRVIAIDTEGSVANPWCLSFAVRPGEAYVIRSTEHYLLQLLGKLIRELGLRVIMHFAGHDLEVIAALGVDIDPSLIEDTMLQRYELGPMYSQALKLAAYRDLGMVMLDYRDLTREADRKLAVEYLERVLAEGRCADCRGRGMRTHREPAHVVPAHSKVVNTKHGPRVRNMRAKSVPAMWQTSTCSSCEGDGTSWPVPRALPIWEHGSLHTWQPSPVGKRVRRILEDVAAGKTNKDGEPTDPRERWEKVDPPDAIAPVIEALGRMPSATLDMVPREDAINYAARDADATLRLWLLHDPMIDQWGLRDVYETDLAIIPLIVEMQQTGVEVDREYFADLSRQWRTEMAVIRHKLQKLVGYYVNPASSKQVANLLFDRLKLPPVKLTKSKENESTDDKVLEQLWITTKHPAIELIKEHREIHKLDGTYAYPLSKVDSADKRVRMEIRYTRTDTGRLSSAKPRRGHDKHNYIQGQNIPTRTERGKLIRKGFVARPGYLLGSWDLSQIEWRVMAHLTRDRNLMKAFRDGVDLHKMTASLIWSIALGAVTSAQRSSAKNIGFGMGYKITPKGLIDQFAVRGITITEQEAALFISAFLGAYPGIPEFWEQVFAEGRRNGYIRSPSGRIRWVSAIRSKASWVREAAERQAGNFPVQEYAAYILKRIMIVIHRRILPALRKCGHDVRVWLTVHDSIEFEFPEGVEDILDPLMTYVMKNTVRLRVPVTGEGKWGKRWSDCKSD